MSARILLPWNAFENEADTDFALPRNVAWAESVIAEWKPRCGEGATEIPLVIDGVEILEGRSVRDCLDPSRPGTVVGRYRQANEGDVERAVACARDGGRVWRELDPRARAALLGKVASENRRARGDLIGAAIADGGKAVLESDPEVSEAVDFVEFYRASAMRFHALANVEARGKGVVVVVSSWNFPIAIPCGGVAAALAAAIRGVYVADAPVLAEGRIELLWYVREQSLSVNYHRYGNLGARATEQRADVK